MQRFLNAKRKNNDELILKLQKRLQTYSTIHLFSYNSGKLRNRCQTQRKDYNILTYILFILHSSKINQTLYKTEAHFCTPVFNGTYYGDVRIPVRPSDSSSVSFPHFFPTCSDILRWNFVYYFVFMHFSSSLITITFRHFLLDLSLFLTYYIGNTWFSALFSLALWQIPLKSYTWLGSNKFKIEFE